MDAFLYLRVRPGAVEDVVVQPENARGVRAAVAVIGDWDVLAALHAPSLNAIAEAVARDVHRIDGVLRTVTAPVVPGDVLGIAGGGLRRPVPLQRRGEACFVHVRAAAGAAAHVVDAIGELEDVAAVALIAGEYDLIVEVPYAWEQAARVIVGDLRSLEGIAATRTLVAVPELEPEDDRDQFSAWS